MPILKTAQTRPPDRNRGFVLVCVLWVLAILTILSLGFGQRALLDARAAAYSMDYAKAMAMARGAVQRGIAEVRNKAIVDWYGNKEGGTGLGQAWAHPKDMLKEGLYYSLGGEEYSKEKCKYLIEDEERRICLNTSDERIIENVPGLRGGDVRKIIRRRTEGSEDGEERQKQFQTIEELRYLFHNIDDTIWFGDGNTPGLRDLLTRWGNGLINVNTASAEVLECIPDLRAGAVGAIMNFRAGQDGKIGTEDDKWFNDLGQVTKETGISMDALQPYCTVQSQFYTITGIATLRQGKVRASCRATVVVTEASANILQWREEPIGS